ncbi:MAG TPA: hypothetical protein DIU15_14720, partial [Deltaproteobacteria bacterium]|nr:hypothetical protein [Deltaproteobacteria bacterium]
GLGSGSVILDYGCGPALGVSPWLDAGVEVLLYDRSPHFQEQVRQGPGCRSGVSVLGDDELALLGEGVLDAVVVCSVLQYLTDEERTALLSGSLRWLKKDGVLALVDVVPSDYSLPSDLLATLRSDLLSDRLLRAPGNALALAGSVVRRSRSGLSLRRYGDDELVQLLTDAGFDAEVQPRNFKPNPSRRTWLARPSLSSPQ